MLKAAVHPHRDGRPRPASVANFRLSRVQAEGWRPGSVPAGLLFAGDAMRPCRCRQIWMALLINAFGAI